MKRFSLPQYAECVNSGKSNHNEDQAAFNVAMLHHASKDFPDLPYVYFGIFDGHAGFGASLAASHQFHHILHEKVIKHFILPLQKRCVAIEPVHGEAYFTQCYTLF